jgi:hypothetical protein
MVLPTEAITVASEKYRTAGKDAAERKSTE